MIKKKLTPSIRVKYVGGRTPVYRLVSARNTTKYKHLRDYSKKEIDAIINTGINVSIS